MASITDIDLPDGTIQRTTTYDDTITIYTADQYAVIVSREQNIIADKTKFVTTAQTILANAQATAASLPQNP